MSIKPCDELAADIIGAQEKIFTETCIVCTLSLTKVEQMVGEAEHAYGRQEEFGDILEHVLWLNEPYLHDVERACYKCALGMIFGRRARYKRSKNHVHGRDAPFAPR